MHNKPSIGRIVHYKDRDSKIRPGIITLVYADDNVNITVFNPNREDYVKNCTIAEGPTQAGPGEWWWPERI